MCRYLSRHVEHLNKEGWVIQICLQVSVCSPLLPFVLPASLPSKFPLNFIGFTSLFTVASHLFFNPSSELPNKHVTTFLK